MQRLGHMKAQIQQVDQLFSSREKWESEQERGHLVRSSIRRGRSCALDQFWESGPDQLVARVSFEDDVLAGSILDEGIVWNHFHLTKVFFLGIEPAGDIAAFDHDQFTVDLF